MIEERRQRKNFSASSFVGSTLITIRPILLQGSLGVVVRAMYRLAFM